VKRQDELRITMIPTQEETFKQKNIGILLLLIVLFSCPIPVRRTESISEITVNVY